MSEYKATKGYVDNGKRNEELSVRLLHSKPLHHDAMLVGKPSHSPTTFSKCIISKIN